jgi:acyl carrier protein
MSPAAAIQEIVKSFLMTEFFAGQDPAELGASTPLITAGILDSVATLSLVAFLEETFDIQIEAREVKMNHLNTLADIERLVLTKQGRAKTP